MYKSLIALTIFASTSSTAVAQTAPPAPSPKAAQAKPRTVKKVICRRVDDEETTGSRLGSAPKVCKSVEVPTGGSASDERAPVSRPERG